MKKAAKMYEKFLICSLAVLLVILFSMGQARAAEATPSDFMKTAANLPIPRNIPAGTKNAAVTYRLINQTVYAACNLFVRSGPGSEYPFIGRLSQGQTVERGAIGNNGWSQILFEGREAYAASICLSVAPVEQLPENDGFSTTFEATDDTLSAVCTTKLRSGPGSEYAVVGHLTPGNAAHRIAIGENGWSRIIFHDREAYACTGDLKGSVSPDYVPVNETLYTAVSAALWSGPGQNTSVLEYLPQGTAVTRIAKGRNGWSQVVLGNQEGYICTGYLSEDAQSRSPAIVTSEPELPTPNSPFIFQYMAPENVMPHGFFSPINADYSKPLPLIISLHGALEVGESPETLESNFMTKEFRNWEYTGLEGFDAYIVCPQLTGYGYSSTWRSPEAADKLFALIDYLKENYPIDENRISIEGHSLGGEGVIYMAADPRACFSAVVPVSAYNPYVAHENIKTAVRGYSGSPFIPAPREDWDSYHYMKSIFDKHFGIQNWFVKNCSHYDIPMVAFEEDADGNGQSDLIEWMLSQ